MMALVLAFQNLNARDEIRRFLSDLLTEDEIELCAKRLQAADMLNETIPYTLIQKDTGLSSATIAKIARALKGENGGYLNVLARINPLPFSRRTH